MTRMLALGAALLMTVTVAACSDRDDDAVQAPASPPVRQADGAATDAAVAFGMTRDQLEDADVVSRANADLGDVETLVLDASGALTHLVVQLNGPGDMEGSGSGRRPGPHRPQRGQGSGHRPDARPVAGPAGLDAARTLIPH